MARHEDKSLLEAALRGYTSQLSNITTSIADIQQRLRYAGAGGVPAPVVRTARPRKPKSNISAEGRARIAEAQRKRWAAQKKGK